jgi:hypothetical protein
VQGWGCGCGSHPVVRKPPVETGGSRVTDPRACARGFLKHMRRQRLVHSARFRSRLAWVWPMHGKPPAGVGGSAVPIPGLAPGVSVERSKRLGLRSFTDPSGNPRREPGDLARSGCGVSGWFIPLASARGFPASAVLVCPAAGSPRWQPGDQRHRLNGGIVPPLLPGRAAGG